VKKIIDGTNNVLHVSIRLGIPIRSNLDNSINQQYAALIKSLADKARSTIRDIDPTNELVFFRMRTKKHEILVAPG
jgi:dynein light chain roadblock-type